jgi:hypothetical protein
MSASDGRVVRTDKIIDNGPDSERWNLVIIGDGYRETELTTYHTDVDRFVSTLRATAPFDELSSAINIHRIDVVSDDGGADNPNVVPAVTVDTFFDAKFWDGAWSRVLTINTTLARSVVATQVPAMHQVVCIVNTSTYGGSGAVNEHVATCSTHPASALVAIHEMGHSAFGLADEYPWGGFPPPTAEPPQPNVTINTDRGTIKWRALILDDTPIPTMRNQDCGPPTDVDPSTLTPDGPVGAYEGALQSRCNVYRPVSSCKMLANTSPFCPVCSGVIRATLEPFLPS